MDQILQWIGSNQVIAWLGSLIIAIPVIWKAVEAWSPKIRKAIKITAKVADLCDTILTATDDKVITKEEVEAIMQHVTELQEALK